MKSVSHTHSAHNLAFRRVARSRTEDGVRPVPKNWPELPVRLERVNGEDLAQRRIAAWYNIGARHDRAFLLSSCNTSAWSRS